MSVDVLKDLFAHLEWGDSLAWGAVERAPHPPDERLQSLLAHMHQTQEAFLQLWQGETRVIPASFASLAAMRAWAEPLYAMTRSFIEAATEAQLGAPVTAPWAERVTRRLGRPPASATVADTVLQVVVHSAHHRGQVMARLRELGVDPPLVDYIAWVWLGRPRAEWAPGPAAGPGANSG